MDPLNVECTTCLAVRGEHCTTVRGVPCRPHASRVGLAAAPDPCDECGAEYGQPCRLESGKTRLYPHPRRGPRNQEKVQR